MGGSHSKSYLNHVERCKVVTNNIHDYVQNNGGLPGAGVTIYKTIFGAYHGW